MFASRRSNPGDPTKQELHNPIRKREETELGNPLNALPMGVRILVRLTPDYSSRKHNMSKRARHIESDQRVTGYSQKTAGSQPG